MIFYIFFIILLIIALWCSIQISIHDFKQRIIPDKYLFPLMLCGLCLVVFFHFPTDITNATIGATFGYILSATVGYVFEHAIRHHNTDTPIGMGDIKLIGVGGLWLGTNGLALALIIACLTGYIWARTQNQKFIPFGPFFLLGGFLTLITSVFLL